MPGEGFEERDAVQIISDLLADNLAGAGCPTSDVFPKLSQDEYLICEYRDANSEDPKFAVVGSYDEMIQWFNAARHNWATIDGWRVVKDPLSSE